MADKPKPSPKRRKRGATRSPDAAQRNSGPSKHAALSAPGTGRVVTEGVRSGPSSRTLATIPIHVRWRDLDAFNHVNNSSYLTYLEEARLQWLRTVPGEWFTEHAMPVMASVELHYRTPITWPGNVDVLLGCGRIGDSSVTIDHRIVDHEEGARVFADGHVVLVWVDPATGQSVALPDAIRVACAM